MKQSTLCSDLVPEPVRTVLLLAAGTGGSCITPLTELTPKCLVTFNEISKLERLVSSLQNHNFNRLVAIIGHQKEVFVLIFNKYQPDQCVLIEETIMTTSKLGGYYAIR